jgi:hypothetical protein
MCQEKTRPDPRAFVTNLKGPQPWSKKIRLLISNNWLKLITWHMLRPSRRAGLLTMRHRPR